jgi:hypothetical protein
MPKLHFVRIANVEREKAFRTATDFESFKIKLPQYFKLIRIRSIRDYTSVIEVHAKIAEKEFVMLTKHVIKPPEIHETFILSGDAKGSHITEKYENLPNSGVRITIDMDLKLKGILRLSSIFSKNKMKDSISVFFNDFVKMIEV